jgi:hypothetical protein
MNNRGGGGWIMERDSVNATKTMKNTLVDKNDSYHTLLDFMIEPANISKEDMKKLNNILNDK